MTAQVVHEAEHTRQHARHRLPTRLVIGKHRFPVNEWSVSGLSLEKLPKELWLQRFMKGRLVFDFGEVDTSIEVELELVHRDEPKQLGGYRYINLGRAQLATLHHVINATLSGDIVDAGDVIEVIKRDAFTPKSSGEIEREKQTWGRRIITRIRRIAAFLLFLAVVAGLLTFIAYSVYNRLFVVESVAARVDGPVVVIRSPQPSYFEPLAVSAGRELEAGDLLATMKLIGGGSASIESPCRCRIISLHVLSKEFVARGEPLLTLFPLGEPLFIVAKFNFEQVPKLAIGQSAHIRLATGQVLTGKIRDVRSGESIEQRHAAPLKSPPIRPIAYADVIIEPMQSLDTGLLGAVASVRIDTFAHR